MEKRELEIDATTNIHCPITFVFHRIEEKIFFTSFDRVHIANADVVEPAIFLIGKKSIFDAFEIRRSNQRNKKDQVEDERCGDHLHLDHSKGRLNTNDIGLKKEKEGGRKRERERKRLVKQILRR